MKFTCPSCREDAISFRQKVRTGYWQTVNCPNCGARLTAYPLLLLIMSMVYVWNVLFFAGLAYFEQQPLYLAAGVAGWLILDFLSAQLIPLAAMKPKDPA